GEVGGMEPRDSGRQNDVRAGGFEGNIPVIAGDIPIEFVVILEEAQAIANAIMKRNISRGVCRARHKDFDLQIAGMALPFDAKWRAVCIRGADVGKKERIIEAAG